MGAPPNLRADWRWLVAATSLAVALVEIPHLVAYSQVARGLVFVGLLLMHAPVGFQRRFGFGLYVVDGPPVGAGGPAEPRDTCALRQIYVNAQASIYRVSGSASQTAPADCPDLGR